MYEIFEKLCQKNNISAYKVSKDTGITTATITSWKQGKYIPKQDKIQTLADYFNVSVEYLMTGKEKDGGETYYLNEETKEIAQEIFDNKKLKMLFDVSRKASPEHLEAYYNLIKTMQESEKK